MYFLQDALFCLSFDKIDKEVLEKAHQLKVLGKLTGYWLHIKDFALKWTLFCYSWYVVHRYYLPSESYVAKAFQSDITRASLLWLKPGFPLSVFNHFKLYEPLTLNSKGPPHLYYPQSCAFFQSVAGFPRYSRGLRSYEIRIREYQNRKFRPNEGLAIPLISGPRIAKPRITRAACTS